jgi:hypothetical protein
MRAVRIPIGLLCIIGIKINLKDIQQTPPEKAAQAKSKTYRHKKTTENFISIMDRTIHPIPDEKVHMHDMEKVPESVTEALNSKYEEKWKWVESACMPGGMVDCCVTYVKMVFKGIFVASVCMGLQDACNVCFWLI